MRGLFPGQSASRPESGATDGESLGVAPDHTAATPTSTDRSLGRGTALVPTDESNASGRCPTGDGGDAGDAQGRIRVTVTSTGAERSLVQIQSPRFREARFASPSAPEVHLNAGTSTEAETAKRRFPRSAQSIVLRRVWRRPLRLSPGASRSAGGHLGLGGDCRLLADLPIFDAGGAEHDDQRLDDPRVELRPGISP